MKRISIPELVHLRLLEHHLGLGLSPQSAANYFETLTEKSNRRKALILTRKHRVGGIANED